MQTKICNSSRYDNAAILNSSKRDKAAIFIIVMQHTTHFIKIYTTYRITLTQLVTLITLMTNPIRLSTSIRWHPDSLQRHQAYMLCMLVHFSVRDSILLLHRFESIRIRHINGFVADFFFPLWRADFKTYGFPAEYAGCVFVSGKKKLRGYERMGPESDYWSILDSSEESLTTSLSL